MIISYEFILNKDTKLYIGSFFESALYQQGNYIKKSFGSDNFHIQTVFKKGDRISAIGRNCIIQIPLEELPTTVQVPKPSQITLESIENLEVLCRTNIFLSKECFCNYITLLVCLDNKKVNLPLDHYTKEVIFIEKGRYLISLSNII